MLAPVPLVSIIFGTGVAICTEMVVASCNWVDVLIFTSFYLEPYIWPDAILWWIWQRNSECASNFVQNSEKVSRVVTSDKSWIYGYDPETEQQSSQWKSLNSPRPKKAWQVKNKVKSILIIFFDIKGIVHKEFILAGQTVNSTYYCDVLRQPRENVRRLHPKLWWHKNWFLHHENAPFPTYFFSTNFFLPKVTWLSSPHPPYLPDLTSCDFFPCPKFGTVLAQLRWSGQNYRRNWTPSQNMTSRKHFTNAEALGTVHTRRRGLLWG
jgi:hypothetical protein